MVALSTLTALTRKQWPHSHRTLLVDPSIAVQFGVQPVQFLRQAIRPPISPDGFRAIGRCPVLSAAAAHVGLGGRFQQDSVEYLVIAERPGCNASVVAVATNALT